MIKFALAKIARDSKMSSQPIQPTKADIHIQKLALDKTARASKIASQPSQPLKTHMPIL